MSPARRHSQHGPFPGTRSCGGKRLVQQARAQARTHFSRILEQVARGEKVVISKAGEPLAHSRHTRGGSGESEPHRGRPPRAARWLTARRRSSAAS
ncbi:type II toxin-antitoxin system prevent-host-death family antitoxin [Actinacidiphila oryziradicis]|uniref:Type II toxin-antitoxin system prevent-host-death family antitoxin n=1 Tax=Actinacidiphila oryziradicis TaxID=2571141 RepID=A0A4U0SD00_9ACTN|nr:type II toxin-antitoxin system prevent-host-death family antitoxin [Actinacidiphila oryziradicis]